MLCGFGVAGDITIGCARELRHWAVSQWLGVTAGEDSFAETVFMKRRLILAGAVSLTLWISSQARGQNSQPGSSNPSIPCAVSADDRALREIPERWREAYNEGNASQVAALYAEDVLLPDAALCYWNPPRPGRNSGVCAARG